MNPIFNRLFLLLHSAEKEPSPGQTVCSAVKSLLLFYHWLEGYFQLEGQKPCDWIKTTIWNYTRNITNASARWKALQVTIFVPFYRPPAGRIVHDSHSVVEKPTHSTFGEFLRRKSLVWLTHHPIEETLSCQNILLYCKNVWSSFYRSLIWL